VRKIPKRQRGSDRCANGHPGRVLDVFQLAQRYAVFPKGLEQRPASRGARVSDDTFEFEEYGVDHGGSI
jgi:hypothetical protein